MFPKIPTAFIQIGLGVIIFILPIPMHFEFDSEVFMMAVIAPLLFVEGHMFHELNYSNIANQLY